ncbi:mannosylglucosyl-3-phosphoglycerate phosphatase-like [Haliotis cracherodii]|uniref:mannosylglucosyl-3-phosphoglycerate phosphatase-like n=1 Tax=Haliotis cracherodii TaxID=6455 RepID=UPI0039EC2CE6
MSFTIIHFNDVYNIEPQSDEPLGGAARFAGYVAMCKEQHPLVLFSGDALNPSLMSIFLKGEQMLPVLNGVGVNCAVYGNHDFDFGVDHLEDFAEQSSFPWLLSNVKDNLAEEPLALGEIAHSLVWNDIKIGFVGLVEEEWIETLATLDPEDVTYLDFVTEGQRLTSLLKKEQGCDMVIALTHMRWPNDRRLAESVPDIDIILGGHDHDYGVEMVNNTYIVKSGTDFRNLSNIKVTRTGDGWEFDIQRVDLDSSIPEDPLMKEIVDSKLEAVGSRMDEELGEMAVEMDGRFQNIRTQETNLGNFVMDIMLTATKAEIALLNSGTFRSDKIHPKGVFKIRDLLTILPLVDPLVVLKVTGSQLHQALENGVSKYPKLEGRFPQVSGMVFGFDPSKPPGERVDSRLVKVQGGYLELDRVYTLCTKEYIATGKDGYDVFKTCEIVVSAEQCQSLSTTVNNHFDSVKIYKGQKPCKSGHRQSLLCLARKTSMVRQASMDQVHKPYPLVRQQSIHEAEAEQCYLAPKIDHRIFQYNDEKLKLMLALKPQFSRILSKVSEDASDSVEMADEDN